MEWFFRSWWLWGGVAAVIAVFFSIISVIAPVEIRFREGGGIHFAKGQAVEERMERERIAREIGQIRYAYQKRTELCFMLAPSRGSGAAPRLIVPVPCANIRAIAVEVE